MPPRAGAAGKPLWTAISDGLLTGASPIALAWAKPPLRARRQEHHEQRDHEQPDRRNLRSEEREGQQQAVRSEAGSARVAMACIS